ncbi:MAG TPA: RNA polymerase sigma factor, partial [Gemmataceae bacterium]|nr:RNA polymerase sigma factor [Gemmataceae bacterium]
MQFEILRKEIRNPKQTLVMPWVEANPPCFQAISRLGLEDLRVRFAPDTVVIRDQLYSPPRPAMTSVRDIPGSDSGPQASSATSRSLLARVQADEAQAWERLVNLYAPLVFQWCRSRGLQDPDVADVVQEVFRAVVAHVGTFRKEKAGDTFRGWLRRITQNKLHDHFRGRGREARGVGGSSAQDRLGQLPQPEPADGEPAEGAPAPDETSEGPLFARALELIRAEFAEQTWAAFWQTAVEDRAAKDVAADLAMSPGAVRVAKCR